MKDYRTWWDKGDEIYAFLHDLEFRSPHEIYYTAFDFWKARDFDNLNCIREQIWAESQKLTKW